MNAAAALVVADAAGDMEEGIALAARSIDSGRAYAKLEALQAFTQNCQDRGTYHYHKDLRY